MPPGLPFLAQGGDSGARSRPVSGKLSNEPRLPPNRGQGDLSLTREGGRHIVLRKDEVEFRNSGYYRELQNLRDPLHFPTSAVLKEPD